MNILKKVAIIGGGPTGIGVGRELKEAGLPLIYMSPKMILAAYGIARLSVEESTQVYI